MLYPALGQDKNHRNGPADCGSVFEGPTIADTTPEPDAPNRKQPKRQMKTHHKIGVFTIFSLFSVAVIVVGVAFALLKRGVDTPVWVIQKVEERLNETIPAGTVAIGSARVELVDGLAPDLVLRDVVYLGGDGKPLAHFDRVQAVFATSPLFSAELHPKRVNLEGARIALRRDRGGQLNVSLGPEVGSGLAATGDINEVILSFKRVFDLPTLNVIEDVSIRKLDFDMVDEQSGKSWTVRNGALAMNTLGGQIDVAVAFSVQMDDGAAAPIALALSAPREGVAATFGMTVRDVDARDIAVQSPALSWLGVLDAPISGALRSEILPDGRLGDLDGTLEIGAGALQPTANTRPIVFRDAKTYFSYDPETAKITFDEVKVRTQTGEFAATGFSYLQEWEGQRPNALVTQFQVQNFAMNPAETLPEPAVFDGGALDMRLRLDPFSLDIGQLSLTTAERHILAKGRVSTEPEGWQTALDLEINTIDHDSLLALWPVKVAPRTRGWLNKNVTGGRIHDVNAAIRTSPGTEPRTSLGYQFSDAQVRYMKSLPPVENGRGYATLFGPTMSIVVEDGGVTAPNGGRLDVAGTVISMPDVRLRPSPMVVDMKVRGEIPAALALLDMEPFNFLSKNGQPLDIANGQADLSARLGFDIVKKVQLKDVDYNVEGALRGVTSDKIVAGKHLVAPELALSVNTEGMEISGQGWLFTAADEARTAAENGVPFNALWQKQFGPEHIGNSKVSGSVELSERFVSAFNLGLPKGMLRGAGTADIDISMEKDEPPAFTFSSDLNQLGLRIPELGWSSSEKQTGRLNVSGLLGTPPQIDALEIEVGGLTANGKVGVGADGDFEAAEFSRVRVGNWLDAPVVLRGRGKGAAPEIQVLGGRIDVRGLKLGGNGGASGGATRGAPITLALDRLVVSDKISLSGFRGNFTGGAGFKGTFNGRLNGEVPVSGTVAPSEHGTAVRVRSEDAGGAFRAAGLFKSATKGAMDLILAPRAQPGTYNGRLTANGVRVKDAPALAGLLNAISVVGLLEQLDDTGLLFTDVIADFVIEPNRVTLTRSSAVGASLGVSMAGQFDTKSNTLNMSGVISPFYLLNGIGSFLTRRGEGLFGFNYDLTGTTAAPRIAVNPFSILTPGMFREIFRVAPPPPPSGIEPAN
ncbi:MULTISPECIES: hypothetical protein [Halocynthiibacter]|uniref:hypothetical protein n=1 Tax=Halocynthiibacter TaxID=1579315 RepID=UPI0021F1FF8D|nr:MULTISPECIES: hypothetical protein [Halocynthiibacter]